jgi:hypothetical protein
VLDRIQFRRADPVSLPAEYRDFAVVLLNDIITEVPSPGSLLGRLAGERGLVARQGLLLILSDFAWNQASEESLWFGGRLDDQGEPLDSASELLTQLAPAFTLLERRVLPYRQLIAADRAIVGEKQLLIFSRN